MPQSLFQVPLLDAAALVFFVASWAGYALALEQTAYGRSGLNARMNGYREVWMQEMLARDLRMVDAQVLAALQNGTAFFASTSLIAIGGTLTVMRSSEEILRLVASLPFAATMSHTAWDAKVIGLAVIFVYAFFKFAWAYRLFNYVAIMLGATPPASEKDTAAAQQHSRRVARLFSTTGRHFNRGQRAFFFALGYLGWFLGPVPFILSTAAVVLVMWRRQFYSDSLRALLD